ncbi:MAG: hypothetical protein WDN25_23105 [Acetobacteraceae bacterium]
MEAGDDGALVGDVQGLGLGVVADGIGGDAAQDDLVAGLEVGDRAAQRRIVELQQAGLVEEGHGLSGADVLVAVELAALADGDGAVARERAAVNADQPARGVQRAVVVHRAGGQDDAGVGGGGQRAGLTDGERRIGVAGDVELRLGEAGREIECGVEGRRGRIAERRVPRRVGQGHAGAQRAAAGGELRPRREDDRDIVDRGIAGADGGTGRRVDQRDRPLGRRPRRRPVGAAEPVAECGAGPGESLGHRSPLQRRRSGRYAGCGAS